MKLTLFIAFLLPLITISNSNAQGEVEQEFEKIKKEWQTESDREKIESCLKIAQLSLPQDTVLNYLDRALVLAKKMDYDSTYYLHYFKSIAYYHLAKFDQAINEIRKAKPRAKFTDHPKENTARIFMMVGTFKESLNQLDSAAYYFQQTRSLLANDTTQEALAVLGTTNTNEANMFFKNGDYKKALSAYLEGVTISENTNEYRNQFSSLYNAANCYLEMDNPSSAINYYQQAEEVAEENNDVYYQGTALIGLGETWSRLNQNQVAISALLHAKEILEKTNQKEMLTTTYINLSTCYMKDTLLDQAEYYIQKAKASNLEAEDAYTRCNVFLNSSILYQMNGDNEKALEELVVAEQIAKENHFLKLEIDCLKEKMKVMNALKNYPSTVAVAQRLMVLKDSLLNTENLQIIDEIETKYQTEKKEKLNLQLQAKNAEQALQLEKENRRKQGLMIGLLGVLAALGVLWYFFERKKKHNKIIATLHREMHHRMTNNLSNIDALIDNLKYEISDDKLKSKLEDLQHRIEAFSEVHKILYQNTDVAQLDLKNYITNLASKLQRSFNQEKVKIDYNITRNLKIPIKRSFPIGLIVNEFLTNSFKYAFQGKQDEKRVSISITEGENEYFITLADNGIGFSDTFDVTHPKSYGMTLMQLLSQQLQGSFAIQGKQGVEVKIQFPKNTQDD